METITKTFDADVPDEVQREVRKNMRAEGWTYKGTAETEDPAGRPLLVQSYERIDEKDSSLLT